jgi:hypothetical protein
MIERLTWAEIEQRYPDEWVLLADPEFGDDVYPASAAVVHHSKDRQSVETWPSSGARREGLFFTGALFEPDVAYLMALPAA